MKEYRVTVDDKENLYDEFRTTFPVQPQIGWTIALDSVDLDESFFEEFPWLEEFDELTVVNVTLAPKDSEIQIHCVTRYPSKKGITT